MDSFWEIIGKDIVKYTTLHTSLHTALQTTLHTALYTALHTALYTPLHCILGWVENAKNGLLNIADSDYMGIRYGEHVCKFSWPIDNV